MVFAKTTSIIHCSIQKLADSMVEIATISMQSILTAKHGIHLTLAMVTAITTLPTIQKLADTMVEIVFYKLILKYVLYVFHTNNICNTTFDNIQLETKQNMNDAKNVLISQCVSSKTGMTIVIMRV